MTQKAAPHPKADLIPLPKDLTEEITQADKELFDEIISIQLTPEQEKRITLPTKKFPKQKPVFAIHWHPEHIPMELIAQRIDAMFPNRNQELIIPTQHNQLVQHGDYTGVEVDAYSQGFNQKVQLLLHFENQRLNSAQILKQMLAHTFKYRSSQLFDFIHTLVKPIGDRIETAARETGANEALIHFVRVYVQKIQTLLDQNMDAIPPAMIKNKLLRNYFNGLRPVYGDPFIDRAQTFLQAVKYIVKANSSLNYFYRATEVIEEARSLGAGIVIPHPEQFWPILLADYDVDGYEVWNPQSRRYTEFLISVLTRKNKKIGPSVRRLLVFMGDDTHMGEKVVPPKYQNRDKASREIGYQPPWEDLSIKKTLIKAHMNRSNVLEEYCSRLNG